MIYEPNRKEIKQIQNLNEAYKLMKKAIKLIDKNVPHNDNIDLYKWRIMKNISYLFGSVNKVLQKNILNKQFFDIVNPKNPKRKK